MKKSKRSMENNSDTKKVKNSFSAWFEDLKEFMSGRFSLEEDKAQRDEVVATVEKGVVFRGPPGGHGRPAPGGGPPVKGGRRCGCA